MEEELKKQIAKVKCPVDAEGVLSTDKFRLQAKTLVTMKEQISQML